MNDFTFDTFGNMIKLCDKNSSSNFTSKVMLNSKTKASKNSRAIKISDKNENKQLTKNSGYGTCIILKDDLITKIVEKDDLFEIIQGVH